MKHKRFILLPISLLVLSGCSLIDGPSIDVEEKTGSLYSLVKADTEEVKSIETYKTKDFSYQVVKGKDHVPYLTNTDYYLLFSSYLKKDGYKVSISDSVSSITWKVTNPSNEAIFIAQISPRYKNVIITGDMSAALTTAKDYSKSSLSIKSNMTAELLYRGYNYKMGSYSYGYTTFSYNNKVYFPLSLLENIFTTYTGIYHLYNYNRFIQYTDYEEMDKVSYRVNEVTTSAFKEMKTYISYNFASMPLYLREDRLNAFVYIMENQYGLKETWKVKSMYDYLNTDGLLDKFLSEKDEERTEAYAKVFALLNDPHTSIRDSINVPWKKGNYNSSGEKITQMVALRSELSAQRDTKVKPGEVYFSTDEKLAYFSFDGFTFAMNAYQDDGVTLKSDLSFYDSPNYDTFFYFLRMFEEIKFRDTVKDVVIDVSCNGGGTVGILMKLLALLSKDNKGVMHLKECSLDVVQAQLCSVDSNNDGVYDTEDVYGDDFNFYILTSPYSFSCGNAFPFYAKQCEFAKIIGVKSGGGECAVYEAHLPSGERFYHSSNLHIGWYDELTKNFEGDEPGVEVDIPIEYHDFYNLDAIQSIISK